MLVKRIQIFLHKNVTLLSTEAILEGLANELRRIVEEREAKNEPASKEELDALDLKLRSLRTQLRKAEENSNALAKQKRELEEKMKKNTNDVSLFFYLEKKQSATFDLSLKVIDSLLFKLDHKGICISIWSLCKGVWGCDIISFPVESNVSHLLAKNKLPIKQRMM